MHGGGLVRCEISGDEMTRVFADYVHGLGIRSSGISIRFEGKRMVGSAQVMRWRMFGVRGFKVAGTFAARDGKLRFHLEDLSPSVPFTRFVAPRIETVIGSLLGEMRVTQVDGRDGTLFVSGYADRRDGD